MRFLLISLLHFIVRHCMSLISISNGMALYVHCQLFQYSVVYTSVFATYDDDSKICMIIFAGTVSFLLF